MGIKFKDFMNKFKRYGKDYYSLNGYKTLYAHLDISGVLTEKDVNAITSHYVEYDDILEAIGVSHLNEDVDEIEGAKEILHLTGNGVIVVDEDIDIENK